MIQSPLNYTGGKYKLMPQIKALFPTKIDTFVDMFCGGCNVGVNTEASHHIYVDSNEAMINLFSIFQTIGSYDLLSKLDEIIAKYKLSDVREYGYEYYGCNSSDGLSKYNRSAFLELRKDFNNAKVHNEHYYLQLYVLIIYAFNNQLRFNSKGEFNLPPGKRDFNLKMRNKVVEFVNAIQNQDASFVCTTFEKFNFNMLGKDDLVYADPPYLITCASYNEQGGWTEEHERELLNFLDDLHSHNIRFALSNVIESKGKINLILKEWIESHSEYKMIELNYSYKNSNYQRQNKNTVTREILVINY